MSEKTVKVIYKDRAWKIMEEDRVVGSYAARAVAARRALQKAEAASSRGDTVLVLLHNRRNELESSRALPTSRKTRGTTRYAPTGIAPTGIAPTGAATRGAAARTPALKS